MTPSDYFSLFGVKRAFKQDPFIIKQNYLKLQKKIHPDNFVDATSYEKQLAIKYAASINKGYQILCSPIERAIYLLELHGVEALSETATHMPEDFLLEQMELRERIFNAQETADLKEHEQAKERVKQKIEECEKLLAIYLDETPLQLEEARLWVQKMQFYLSILKSL